MSTTTADRIASEYTVPPDAAEIIAQIEHQLEELTVQNWPFATSLLTLEGKATLAFQVKVTAGPSVKIQSRLRISRGAWADERTGYADNPDQNTLPLK